MVNFLLVISSAKCLSLPVFALNTRTHTDILLRVILKRTKMLERNQDREKIDTWNLSLDEENKK